MVETEYMNVMLAAFLGGWEIILILAVVLILFGAKKLPELAKGLGTGIKEFKKATREVTDEIQNSTTTTPVAPAPPAVKLPPANTTPQSAPPETKVI
jgi:sec-independent protein translocase protein TatA